MRWYCVHPSLPLQAELRIRVAPDCNAAECARIPQGRAVAACSPVFQMPNNDIDAKPISWLQVAYQDAVSGETDGGFVMATLPDGTALVTPWEVTNYCGCCEIMDSAALLLDGPHVGARSVGSVQNVKFLYCTVEEGEKRIRIFHPELESVWIDKKDLQIVCTRLKHQQCKIPHTFFELTEALPDEAQIAIRNFPSQKAQTVGLLSRGETLEVVVRGGNWLQIAGGNVDKAWIMWRTDALELLQEAYDVRSDACEEITPNVNADIEAVAVAASADERPICPARCEVGVETAVSVGAVDDGDAAVDADEEITPNVNADIEAVAVAASADERPICPARCEVGVETAVSVGAVDDGDAAVDADEEITPNVNADIEAVAVAASADERPICPARCEVGVETAVSVGAVDDGDAAVDACEEITPNVNADIEAVAVAASADERPICPARCEVGVETAVSVGAVDDGDAAVDADEEITPNVNADIEAVAVAASADERPICPARCEVEEVVDELIKVLAATGADFDVRDVMKDFAAKYAVAPEMYGAVGRTSGKSGSVSECDAGDFAVLGNLDDVFYPVDEIIVGITSEEDTENSWKDTMSQEKGHLAFDSDNVTSFTFDPQVKSNFAEPDNSASASFLQEFGVIKYCERKKALYPASDRLSHAIFNADQDDADLLFEAFVGDDPLSEEWFHDVASKSFVPTLHVASRPVLKLPLKSTYSLIMGGAAAEAILESELLDDDDGNYDLVSSFKYPLSIRSRAFPLRPSPRQGQSASEDRNPEALQATQLAVPLAGVSTTSRLRVDHRNFIGGPNSIAKPSGTLVRPQSLIHTRAPTSSVPKSVESSGLRTSFGFRRPSSFQKR